MGAINYPMSDIYGGGIGTTEMSIPDADDQNALTDTENKNKPLANTAGVKASKIKFYVGILFVLILIILLGGIR